MIFKLSKFQTILLFLLGLISGIFGYLNTPVYQCIQAPCPSPSPWLYFLLSLIVTVLLIYILLIIYNLISKR